jgi:hypothetical protein
LPQQPLRGVVDDLLCAHFEFLRLCNFAAAMPEECLLAVIFRHSPLSGDDHSGL